MEKPQENELFAHLIRVPRFRQWLDHQLAQQDKVLRVNPDMQVLMKAQGHSQALMSMLDKLTAAEQAAKRS